MKELRSPEVSDALRAGRISMVAAAALAGVAVLAAIDLLSDRGAGVTIAHFLLEGGIVAAGALGAWFLTREAARQRARAGAAESLVVSLRGDVSRARSDGERWRREAAELLQGLSAAIDQQFDQWNLSESEQAVARLLLKGLSHKEIASVRDASEATVRQQATSVYRKSGLGGRAELAAFFLEDLLAPSPPSHEPGPRATAPGAART